MKYYIVKFRISCAVDFLQSARDLLSEAACEAGFEAFEDTECGVDGYVQRQLFDKDALNTTITNYLPMGVSVEYNVDEVPDQDWNEEWEEDGFEPIVVAENLIVYDAKHTDRSNFGGDDGITRIFIEARNAFGTGTHQTTRMILRTMLSMNMQGRNVLDCGCGTGILGIAASMMGASRVVGYDIDEWSANNARHNAVLNGICNIDVLLGDSSVISDIKGTFDVVIANINRNILIGDMNTFSRMLAEGGSLILSGFYEADVPMLEAEAAKYCLRIGDKMTDGDWACIKLYHILS